MDLYTQSSRKKPSISQIGSEYSRTIDSNAFGCTQSQNERKNISKFILLFSISIECASIFAHCHCWWRRCGSSQMQEKLLIQNKSINVRFSDERTINGIVCQLWANAEYSRRQRMNHNFSYFSAEVYFIITHQWHHVTTVVREHQTIKYQMMKDVNS